jgi:hypothetical protein
LDRGNINQPDQSKNSTHGWTGNNVSSGLTQFANILGIGGFDSTEANRLIPEAAGGKITRFIIRATTFTLNVNAIFTIRKNGVDTALTVTMTAAGTNYEIEAEVSYVKGDRLTLEADTTASASGAFELLGWSIAKKG